MNLNVAPTDDDKIDNTKLQSSTATTTTTTTTTGPEICTDFIPTKEVVLNVNVVSKEDVNSNLNIADNYEYLKEDIPVDNEYWNNNRSDVDDNYGVIYNRTNAVNPPSLPQESNMPCI